MTKNALHSAYGRPLEIEEENVSAEWIEKHRAAQVGRVITQDGPYKGGLVLSYKHGLHQVALMNGDVHNLVWVWHRNSNNDPAGISSNGWVINKRIKNEQVF